MGAPSVPEYSFGAIPAGQATFTMATAFKNAINLLKSPGTFMRQNKDNLVPVNTTMINYVVILAAIPFIATLIGDLWFYAFLGFGGYAFAIAILTYIFSVIEVFVVGFVVWKLAPSFGVTTTQSRTTLLAAFAYTPFFLLSIFDIIPFIGAITILGFFYGLYILYIGLPIMLDTQKDKVLTYFIVIVVVDIIVFAVIGAIVGGISTALFLRSVFL
jgi:Yip1 domain